MRGGGYRWIGLVILRRLNPGDAAEGHLGRVCA
jgi:hypothetical protein